MLGNAMLTMKRSREDRNTPVSTISAVRVGRVGATADPFFGSVIKLTVSN